MSLSVIIPVFNEVKTLEEIINQVIKVKIDYKEIIIVDDFSNDGSRNILENFKNNNLFKIVYHNKNKGKGACLISALPFVTGKYVIIQDADLEYDPNEFKKFLEKANDTENCKVIYGSRVLGRKKIKKNLNVLFRIFANYILTLISNMINNQKLTDAHTCYKFMESDILKKLDLSHNDFSICPEITTKLSRLNYNIVEIPISYKGRDFSEGKKIKFKDAIFALSTLLKFRFLWKLK